MLYGYIFNHMVKYYRKEEGVSRQGERLERASASSPDWAGGEW
jgi:hypothetical protein